MVQTLTATITETGINQGDLVKLLNNLVDVVNELQADHGTYKTIVDELVTDHASFRTVVDADKTLLNNVRTFLLSDRLVSGDPGLAISSNFDVAVNNDVVVQISQQQVSIDTSTACDTGTAATFAATKWGIFLVSVDATGTLTATWDDNGNAGYDDEAAAIAALPATPSSEVPLGYVTVQAHASNTFTAGTDALEGGTGGNASADTNYYDYEDTDLGSAITAAVSSSVPSALSASSPAALTNATALTLNGG